MTERRRYALQRIKAGDYLLLDNNGVTIWRISTYTEDGSALTHLGGEIRGTFWGVWKYTGRDREQMDVSDWNDFEMRDALRRSRSAAVAAALRRGAERDEKP